MTKPLLFAFAFFTLITSFGLAPMYPAIGSLFFRDQGYTNITSVAQPAFQKPFPYVDYPFEYPPIAGGFMALINAAAYLVPYPGPALLVSIYLSSVMMGAFAVATYVLLHRMGASLKKIAVFFAFSPLVILSYDLPFDLAAVFFSVLALYFLEKKREGTSSVALALAAGVKAFPLILLFAMIKDVHHRVRYVLVSLGGFLTQMGVVYLLSPTNFFRSGSYLTGYGIEGSWLGLVFGHTIDYLHPSTWVIGQSTQLHLPQPYQLFSLALVGVSSLLVYRSRFDVRTKCLLAFSAIVLFWWWSPPQFLFYVFALLPLVADLDWKTILVSEGMAIAGLFSVWARIPVSIDSQGWVLISSIYQALLALYLLRAVLAKPAPVFYEPGPTSEGG